MIVSLARISRTDIIQRGERVMSGEKREEERREGD
jgi:hypothetical protein